jgi:hypothetical protein
MKYLITILAAALLIFGPNAAQSDTILTGQSVFNQSNTPGETGPFAVLNISLDVTTQTATFDFVGLGNYNFIDTHAIGLDLNSTLVNNFQLLIDSDFKQFNLGAGQNVDGFGTFNFTIDDNNASTLEHEIEFSLHDNGGPAWNSINDVLVFNPNFDAVAHVNFGDGNTGFISESGTFSTPDGGSTVMLLGIALSGIGLARRYLKV